MRSPQGVLDWAAAHPTNPGSGGPNWNNDCVQFVWYAGGFPVGNSAPTANLARAATLAHGHQLSDTVSPPFGWFVYFDGPTRAGHVGMSTGGGKFISATVYESDPAYGPNLGVMRIADYARIRGVSYKGASPYFIDLTLDLSSFAGGGGTPINPDQPEPLRGETMKYIYKEEGGVAWALLDSHMTAGYVQTTSVAEAENYRRVCPTPAVLVSAADFTASIAAAVWHKSLCPAGSGGGGWVPADADIVDEAEMGQALTNEVNLTVTALAPRFNALDAAVADVKARVLGIGISHS